MMRTCASVTWDPRAHTWHPRRPRKGKDGRSGGGLEGRMHRHVGHVASTWKEEGALEDRRGAPSKQAWLVALTVVTTAHVAPWSMAATPSHVERTTSAESARPWNVPVRRIAQGVQQDLETLQVDVHAYWQAHRPKLQWENVRASPSPSVGTVDVAKEMEENRSLLLDLWDVVDRNYYVVGSTSDLDHVAWKKELERALAQANLEDRASTFRAAQNMVRSLSKKDRYTRFLTPVEFDRLRRYDASGIGINLCDDTEYARRAARGDAPQVEENPAQSSDLLVIAGQAEQRPDDGQVVGRAGPRVLGLVPGSAAERAGLQQGDQILAIDNVQLDPEWTPWETTERIRTSGGTQKIATVTVKRRQGGSIDKVKIQLPKEAETEARAAASTTLSYVMDPGPWGGKLGVLTLSEMGASTPREVREILHRWTEQGVDGLLLDLRGNRGGLVPSAVEVARLFLHKDQRVVIAAGGIAEPLAAQEGAQGTDVVPYDLPLAVQVDGRTASAAEILVGALRDNCRAVVVGSQNTFGKGIVQSVYALPQGAGLVLTVGAYETPASRPIHLIGMPPDFKELPSLNEAQEILGKCVRGDISFVHN